MGLHVNVGDKLIPGLNVSVTIKTPLRVKPDAKVKLGANELPATIRHIDTLVADRDELKPEALPEIWKLQFKLPLDAKGEVELLVKAGNDTANPKKAIG